MKRTRKSARRSERERADPAARAGAVVDAVITEKTHDEIDLESSKLLLSLRRTYLWGFIKNRIFCDYPNT